MRHVQVASCGAWGVSVWQLPIAQQPKTTSRRCRQQWASHYVLHFDNITGTAMHIAKVQHMLFED